MTGLINQPLARVEPVTSCAAEYVRENDSLRFDLQAAKTELERKTFINAELRAEKEQLGANWESLKRWVKGKKINFSGDDRFWRGYEDFHGDVRAKMKELEEV